tara:strand:+ start:152 stop:835 length:684 start_codon:yes stop_codon:yes gene_type:complete
MIRNTCIVLVTLIMCACSATEPRTQINKNGVYGIQFPLNYKPKLCHQHIGFTVFNNYANSYDLSNNYMNTIINGYEKGIASTSNSSIILRESLVLENYIEVSTWSGAPKLNSEGKKLLKNVGEELGIDFLLHPTGYTSQSLEYKDQCWGIKLKTGNNNGVPLVPLYSVWVFETRTGEYIGGSFIRNDSFPIRTPKVLEEISSSEIEYYEAMSSKYAEEGIRQLILGN